MLKRIDDVRQFSSRTENSIRNSSSKTKRQKEDDQGKTSGDTDSESDNSCQNTIRKLIPLSRYKKLFKKPAKAGRNQDGSGTCIQEKTPLQVNFEASISIDVVEDEDMIYTNDGAKDERGLCFATNGSLVNKDLKYAKLLDATLDKTTATLKQDHKAKLNGIMHGKMICSLDSYNLPKPSGEEIDIHDPCTMKSEPPPSMLQVKKASFCKISKLPDGCPTELDNDHLSSVNCIRGFWHKSLNAVLIDGQERISKSILFVLSLQSHACRPSLIITSDSLAQWHDSFLRLAPSSNVIIYPGDDARKMIKKFEFNEERCGLMFQVLLADPKAIIDDLVDIARIKWESIIVDDCQNSAMIGYLKQLNTLSIDFKLLLLNGQLKDSLSDYIDLLAFLNPGETIDDNLVGLGARINDPPRALDRAKKKLKPHIVADECKFELAKFFEFWVPVPLSNVQLEQYCATLVSNATALRSNLRTDVVEVLHRILVTAKKCCDHPYLVDGKLQGLVTESLEGAEFLNAEVCASGKLYLLERILQELKNLGLRAVILFQSLGGSGNISLGDILNVFLQQRFGADAYECIESGLVMKKKVDALKKFNNKETGRFVLLIEKRACLSSVKLHSVDAIILFNSDWNPLTDIKSLQRLSITSQHTCIKLFRFYTSYTIEEKLLMLSKQGTHLESNVESISRNIIHSLLGWGASYLFQKLGQLHCSASSALICEPSFDKLCLNDVILEILTQLPGKNGTSRSVPCSFLIKARSSGGKYTRNIVLMGEKEGISVPDKDLPSFWSGLLGGKRPRWIYISESSQRVRKRVQHANEVVLNAVEGDEVKSKRLKIKSQSVRPVLSKVFQEMEDPPKDTNKSFKLESDGREQKLNEQKDLLKLLKPELSELCDIFGLPESVKSVAQDFLVYIMNYHEVSIYQATVLQALKISLCWQAASMLNHDLDHEGTLLLAKTNLKFECTEADSVSVYSKLQILMEKFLQNSAALEKLSSQNIPNNQLPLSKSAVDGREPLDWRAMKLTASDKIPSGVNNEFHVGCESSEQQILHKNNNIIGETPVSCEMDSCLMKENHYKNQVDSTVEVFLKRSNDLVQRQQAEVSEFEKQMHEDRQMLEKTHDLDLELIRCVHMDWIVRNGKTNALTQGFSAKMDRFDQQYNKQKQKLMSRQLEMRNMEQELKCSWVYKAKTDNKLNESLDDVPRLETEFRIETFLDESNTERPFLNSELSSGDSNTESQECFEVPSNIFNEREEDARLGHGTIASFTSVKANYFDQIVQNRISVELPILPEFQGALPIDSGNLALQAEVFKSADKNSNFCASHLQSVHFSGETNTGSKECPKATSKTLNEQEGNARLGDDTSSTPSAMKNDLEQIMQSSIPESSILPVVVGGLAIDSEFSAPPTESSNPISSKPVDKRKNSDSTILNSLHYSGEAITGSKKHLEIPVNTLNELEDNVRSGDDALVSSKPVIVNDLEQIMQNRFSMESLVQPKTEVLKLISSKTSGLLSPSMTTTSFNSEIQEGRDDDSIGLHLVPNQELNQSTLSSVQGFACHVPASTLPSIQEIFTGERTRPIEVFASGNDRGMAFPHEFAVSASVPVVTPSHLVEALGCKDAIPLAEHEQVRFPLAGYKVTSLQLHHSVEQNETPIPQEAVASGIEIRSFNGRLLENVAHSLIPRLCTPSEGLTIEAFRNTVNHPDEAGVHNATAAAVIESEPSIQHLPENTTLRTILLQKHLASENTSSEHLRTSAIESDQQNLEFQNLPSTGWLPPQAISADPLQNELLRVYKQQCSCDKNYEAKKWLIRSECEQEIAKIRMKYDILLQDAERGYVLDQMIFQKIYQKVFWHKVFADEIRANIYDHNKEGPSKSFQAPTQNSSQLFRASWPPPPPQLISRPLSITPPLPSPTPDLVRQPAPHLCGFRPPQATLCESWCLVPAAAPPVHPLPPTTIPSVEPSISQPPVQVELLEFSGAGDLLESMLADLPATGDEFPTTSVMDSRPNAVPDIICLSDED